MKAVLSKILNNKSIAILALIFVTVEAVPHIRSYLNIIILAKCALWISGAIFIWMRKDWASILLGCLALIYFIIDIVLQIPGLITMIRSLSAGPATYDQYFPYVIILSMFIETFFLSCFIYYGFITFRSRLKRN